MAIDEFNMVTDDGSRVGLVRRRRWYQRLWRWVRRERGEFVTVSAVTGDAAYGIAPGDVLVLSTTAVPTPTWWSRMWRRIRGS